MQRPFEDPSLPGAARPNERRLASLAIVAGLHVLVIYAFMSGLAQRVVDKLPAELKAEVVQEHQVETDKPPPPTPQLVQPPAAFVPPPQIVVQTETPPVNAITVQNKAPAPAIGDSSEPDVASAALGSTHNCDSYYPPIAQRLSQQGKVLVHYTVNTDGSIADVSVAETSGFPSLDTAALNCVRQHWRNSPAMKGGKAVASTAESFISFQMH